MRAFVVTLLATIVGGVVTWWITTHCVGHLQVNPPDTRIDIERANQRAILKAKDELLENEKTKNNAILKLKNQLFENEKAKNNVISQLKDELLKTEKEKFELILAGKEAESQRLKKQFADEIKRLKRETDEQLASLKSKMESMQTQLAESKKSQPKDAPRNKKKPTQTAVAKKVDIAPQLKAIQQFERTMRKRSIAPRPPTKDWIGTWSGYHWYRDENGKLGKEPIRRFGAR